MSVKSKKLYAMIKSVRSCFQDLKVLGDRLHQDLGVTASMRAVMEFLDEHGDHTVPDIARAKNVSRQHIQLLCDTLCEKGFTSQIPNPAHKRSPLICLSNKGGKTFATLQSRELILLESMARTLTAQDIEHATQTIESLRKRANQHET